MKLPTHRPVGSCVNVMEELVMNEIEKQTQSLPDGLKSYINVIEVATYALNRLPSFYASSQRGRQQQINQAIHHRAKIKQEVRRALAAVQRDPLRCSQPLISDRDRILQQADAARQEIVKFLSKRQLVDCKEVSWENLASAVLQSFNTAKWQPWGEEDSSCNNSSSIAIKVPYPFHE